MSSPKNNHLPLRAVFLLFDEPLSNLDAKLRIHMRDEIRKIQQEVGITSIYVTHDQAEAMGLSDKVVIMKEGVIEQVGTPQEIYQKPLNEFVANFIGRANIFDGIIDEVQGEYASVIIHNVKYKAKITKDYKAEQKVRVVVRPEGVIVGRKDYNVPVIKSIFMGQIHEYVVDLLGNRVEISEYNPVGKTIFKEKEYMDIGYDEAAIHIL